MDKFAIARALREVGLLLEHKGENPFKVRAYETGARAIEAVQDLERLIQDRSLTQVPGIGEALAKKIAELHDTGKLTLLEELHAELPAGILELARVPALGPRKIAQLQQLLGITNVEDLR